MCNHDDYCAAYMFKDCNCSLKYKGKNIKPLLDRINRLEWALSKLGVGHDQCEDCWYSCPASGECCRDNNDGICDCGSDDHNKFIADTLKEGLEIRSRYFND